MAASKKTAKKPAAKKTTKKPAASKGKGGAGKPPRSWGQRLGAAARGAFFLGLIGGLLGLCGVAGLFVYYGRELPQIPRREQFKPAQMTRIYAAGGELIAELSVSGGKRTVVPMEEIPQHVRDAFMAAEDADFMTHGGIDYLGMARAFYLAVFYDTGLKGTSTITQQVVKNLILTPERSLSRKIKEIILARELERTLTKEDILWLYLNEIYLGHGVNGVEEAARLYFDKPIKDVTLEEAALLAGLTQSPERLTPRRHPERAKKRRAYVLRQLWEKGFIKEPDYRKADAAPVKVHRGESSRPYLGAAPYFVEHVRQQLVTRYGKDVAYQGGLRVHTTLDVKLQRSAEDAVAAGLSSYTKRRRFYGPSRTLKAGDVDGFVAKQARKTRGSMSAGKTYEGVITRVDAEKDLVELRVGDVKAELLLEPRGLILGVGKDRKALDKKLKRGDVLRVQRVGGDLQREAHDGVTLVRFEPGPEVGVILVDPRTHEVRALVGGTSWQLSQYNHATQARRQTGSSFKPVVYGAALEARAITPATLVNDNFVMKGATRYDADYAPKNSDGKNRGLIRIREALGASRNSVAVQLFWWLGGAGQQPNMEDMKLRDEGIKRVEAFARRLGISSPLTQSVTMALGSSELTLLELITAYSTLASGGLRHDPRFITRVEHPGKTERLPYKPERATPPEVAFLIADVMQAVTGGYTDSEGRRRQGTASLVRRLGHPVAGKTGTTNEARDAWFMGFTPRWVAGVWVGRDDNQSLGPKEYGGRVAAPVWLELMKDAHQGLKKTAFTPPARGITSAKIDPKTGKLARTGGIDEHFLSGTEPKEYAPEAGGVDTGGFILDQLGGQ